MGRITQSPEARRDLAKIAVYIARDNVPAAERWLDSIDRTLRLLADNPELGESAEHFKPGMRFHSHGRYVLYYRPYKDGILLYRVLHGSRKLEDLFGKDT